MRSFGGPNIELAIMDMISAGYGRMQAWFKVTLTVMKSEFPDFDAIRAFSALKLSDTRKNSRVTMEADQAANEQDNVNLERLALLLHLNVDDLKKQLKAHRNFARRHYLDTKCTTLAAWKDAIQKSQKHNQTRKRYPIDALNVLLVAYGCMGGSSSGVEQGFSKTLKNISTQSSGHLGCTALEHHVWKLLLDKQLRSQDELAAMLDEARKVWVQCYGFARSGRQGTNLHAGVKRVIDLDSESADNDDDDKEPSPKKKKPMTEVGWLRRRRNQVQHAAQQPDGHVLEDDDGGGLYMTEKHKKEIEFNEGKELGKRISAFKRGTLLEGEITSDLPAKAAEVAAHQAEVDRKRMAQDDKTQRRVAGGKPWPHLRGCKAYVQDDAVYNPEILRTAMTSIGLERVANRSEAQAIGVQKRNIT